mgnify:CR=1 FL=1
MKFVLKTSLINYEEVVNGGVSILMSLTLQDNFSFQCIYWIHPSGEKMLEIDEKFLKIFGIKESKDLPLDKILPEHNEIFKEFLNA